jgi:3-oxoacyl-[acyl-carrier-protein] synthase II
VSHDVLVTGLGLVSCLGRTVAEFWDALCASRCGLGPIRRLDLTGFPYRWAGEVETPEAPRGRSAALCEEAAAEAIDGLGPDGFDPARAAVVAATNFGPMDRIEAALRLRAGKRPVPDDLARQAAFNFPAAAVAELAGFRGLHASLSLSCASGGAAVGYGAELIRAGLADVVLAGGYDTVELTSWAGLGVLRVMVPTPEEGEPHVRPFDRRRAGTLFSEGAAFLLLEAGPHARARGAPPLARLAGWAVNNNAFHLTHADPEGEATAELMAAALRDAGLQPEDVSHINAHGTGTKLNDKIETRAVRTVFGAAADNIPVTSIKAAVGHGMGAAGTFEAVACVQALRHGLVPPTLHYEEPDPDCDLDVVAGGPREVWLRTALSNSAGIGGCNACLVLAECAGAGP